MLEDIISIDIDGKKINAQVVAYGEIACLSDLEEEKYISGTARLITKNGNKLEGLQEFKSGEILITTMTDPSMENEMARALAFVTDIGGQTCHAAIIANNLNKFCIVGTDIATKKIKTGDRIYLGYESVIMDGFEDYKGVVLKHYG